MKNRQSRIAPHIVETNSRNNIRSIIEKKGNALFRDLSERDYGIDAIVELFENGNITGKFALLQLKGTQNTIVPLKKSDEVSCKITASNAQYALQMNIPVILIYASLKDEDNFYFADLRNIITEEHIQKIEDGQTEITVRIPLDSNAQESMQPFFDVINKFYNKNR